MIKLAEVILVKRVFKILLSGLIAITLVSCFKNENKKEKERVFYNKKTWSYGEIIAKIAGNWLRMIIE